MLEKEFDEFRRMNDVEVAKLITRFDDFIARYERGEAANSIHLAEIILTIKAHDDFVKTIKPIYDKGMIALGATVLGIVGLATHWLVSHIKWG